jgi:hypothetical protein
LEKGAYELVRLNQPQSPLRLLVLVVLVVVLFAIYVVSRVQLGPQ